MKRLAPARRRPPAFGVLATVLAFAVVCPLMAAPGIPEDQGCHGGSEPEPATERVSVCCSAAMTPKAIPAEPGPAVVGAGCRDEARAIPVSIRPPGETFTMHRADPPLFVRHAALLI